MAQQMAGEGPPQSKAEYVLMRLRREIAEGVIIPGQPLRQTELAERYGVSSTPVREALRTLEADGAIQYLPHRGATVAELSRRDVHDLYLLRSQIESFATGLAVQRMTEQAAALIRTLHERLAARVGHASPVELSQLNRDLHVAIIHTGSPLIAEQVIGPMWKRFLPPSTSMWAEPEVVDAFIAEHARIVEAIEAGDVDLASKRMADHVLTAERCRLRFSDQSEFAEQSDADQPR